MRLTVVGTARPGGPAEAALDRLALRDAVRFTGPVPEAELVDLLQRAAVVAIPSLYEGFSLPAVEAMACATPLVTTDAGALPEVVGTKAGLRVRAGDVGELTAALQLVLDSPVARRAAGPRRPAAGAGLLHLAGDGAAHRRLVRRDPRAEGAALLTVDYDRLDLRPGMTVLDLGCGEGRHAFEAYRRGASVVAVDWGQSPRSRRRSAGWARSPRPARPRRVPATRWSAATCSRLPVPDASVDRVMASEVLEHIPDDVTAMAEIARVLKPGGRVAVTVPRYGPERICWALSDEYHANEGGHIRIYRRDVVRTRLAVGRAWRPAASHHAHALHAPYWWLKCAVGVDRDAAVVRAYHRLLVWDLTKRPWLTRTAERLLDPLFGKSLVVYADKPAVAQRGRRIGRRRRPPEWERTAAAR